MSFNEVKRDSEGEHPRGYADSDSSSEEGGFDDNDIVDSIEDEDEEENTESVAGGLSRRQLEALHSERALSTKLSIPKFINNVYDTTLNIGLGALDMDTPAVWTPSKTDAMRYFGHTHKYAQGKNIPVMKEPHGVLTNAFIFGIKAATTRNESGYTIGVRIGERKRLPGNSFSEFVPYGGMTHHCETGSYHLVLPPGEGPGARDEWIYRVQKGASTLIPQYWPFIAKVEDLHDGIEPAPKDAYKFVHLDSPICYLIQKNKALSYPVDKSKSWGNDYLTVPTNVAMEALEEARDLFANSLRVSDLTKFAVEVTPIQEPFSSRESQRVDESAIFLQLRMTLALKDHISALDAEVGEPAPPEAKAVAFRGTFGRITEV